MSLLRVIGVIVVLFCACAVVQGQAYELRLYGGANYYQGDLAPTTAALSFSRGQFCTGASAGLQINDVFKLNLKVLIGKIAGDDENAVNPARRMRNLSFVSPLYELGINTELSINRLLPFLDKYGIKAYYTTGINVFHFDPQAFATNQFGRVEVVKLQPLGTEGQGLPGYEDPYRLTQINIPFGLGVSFHLFGHYELGIELSPRATFTDHLDDVSRSYVDPDVFAQNGKQLSAQMANRMGEFLGTGPVDVAEGAMRGNPDNNDWYLFSGVYLSYNFGAGYEPLKFLKLEDLEAGDGGADLIEDGNDR